MGQITPEDALKLADALLAVQGQVNQLAEAHALSLEALAKHGTRLRVAEDSVRDLQDEVLDLTRCLLDLRSRQPANVAAAARLAKESVVLPTRRGESRGLGFEGESRRTPLRSVFEGGIVP